MGSAFLRHLLSFENTSNQRYGATFPLYKFYRLYDDRSSLSDEERQSHVHVPNAEATGFHLLNPSFVSVLKGHSIWFAPSTQFNDPWDAGGAVSILRTNAAIETPILKLLFGEEESVKVSRRPEPEKYKEIEDAIREAFSVLRFACFTRRYDSNPMWAHYAGNHTGACLRFEFMRRMPHIAGTPYSIDPGFTGHYPVRYGDDFAQVTAITDIGAAIQILHTKHPDWSYEKEVRFIKFGDLDSPGKGGTVTFNKSSLTAVILGCKVPPALLRAVALLLDEFGYAHTELVKAEFDYRKQSLKFLKMSRQQQRDPPRRGGA